MKSKKVSNKHYDIILPFLTYTSFNINTTEQFFNGLPRLYITDFHTKSTATQKPFVVLLSPFSQFEFSVSIHDKTFFFIQLFFAKSFRCAARISQHSIDVRLFFVSKNLINGYDFWKEVYRLIRHIRSSLEMLISFFMIKNVYY